MTLTVFSTMRDPAKWRPGPGPKRNRTLALGEPGTEAQAMDDGSYSPGCTYGFVIRESDRGQWIASRLGYGTNGTSRRRRIASRLPAIPFRLLWNFSLV